MLSQSIQINFSVPILFWDWVFINTIHLTRPRHSACVLPFLSSWGTRSWFCSPPFIESWHSAQTSNSLGVCHHVTALDWVPIIMAWAFLLCVTPRDQTRSLFWLYQLTWAECPHSVDDAVWTDSHHTWSRLASQKSSHSPGPDCPPSTTSFSRGLGGRSQKTLLKIWLWVHSDSFCNFFLELYHENFHANKSFSLI